MQLKNPTSMAYRSRSYQRNLKLYRLIIFMVIGLVSGISHADQLLLITSAGNSPESISETEAAQLFLGLGGSDLQPYDQHNTSLRETFYRRVANLSLASVRAHWAKRVFTGRGRPPVIIKTSEINQTFENNPSSVTYIYATQLNTEHKVLLVMDTGE